MMLDACRAKGTRHVTKVALLGSYAKRKNNPVTQRRTSPRNLETQSRVLEALTGSSHRRVEIDAADFRFSSGP